MTPVKVVFFDAGGTLFRPYPSVGEVYARTAIKHGTHVKPLEIEQRFHDAWHERNGLASLHGASSERIEREWWHQLVSDVFSPVSRFDNFEAFFTELYDVFATPDCWRLFDDALPILEALKERGYRLGMISNWDHRLFSIVDGLGLSAYFEQVFASSSVGVAKPGAGIFHRAVDTLGVDPSGALHIGDSLEDDYYGAQRAGLQAVWLDRPRKAAYNEVVKIQTLHDLLPLLS